MGKRWLMIVLVAAFAKVNSAIAQSAIAQGEQGKIINCKGKVEHNPAAQQAWKPAKVFQNLFVKDKVRTFVASRSDILLVNEAQVKLGPDALLTVQLVQGQAEAKQMNLTLQQGKVWIRTKNATAGQLAVNTTEGKIKVTGTEINVEIRPGNETVLTVIEGSADISNNRGSLTVNAGEEASARPGFAPTKRRILNPEDAVQWALYYPTSFPWNDFPMAAKSGAARIGFERLRQGEARGALNAFTPLFNTDIWARIGASMAYVELGELEPAREILTRGSQGRNGVAHNGVAHREVETALHTQLAAVALASGDTQTGMQELLQVLRADPKSLRALTLFSSMKLTQNRKQVALKLASAAVKAHPKSVAALIAASEAAQAYFNLEVAEKLLDRALALDPEEVHALTNRARIRFGSGNAKGAKADAERAATIAPADAQVLSLTGFIKLAEGDINSAKEYFKNAIESDTDLGEPHLGLGLIFFRQDRINEGLLEMLTATLLEPKVSLYQSYLGKAYYQLGRFKEGLSALETAKRLDPHDPTPRLYSSFFLRDRNQQVKALNELRRAIALNDNRAVYRSRFLLDRDLATKNVSLAEVYRQLGFEAWGAAEALNSLHNDFTNASAHLFLTDAYQKLPDRQDAASSELLQYFLYAPVNRNSFNSFNEYTALLEQPRRQLFTFEEIGNERHLVSDFGIKGGNERLAYLAFFNYQRENSARLDKFDTGLQGFVQAKLGLGSNTDLLVSFNRRDTDNGEEVITKSIAVDSLRFVHIRKVAPDPNNTIRIKDSKGTLGFKHIWRVGSALTTAFQVEELKFFSRNPDFPLTVTPPFLSSDSLNFNQRVYNFQIQQTTRLGRHQTIIGAELQRERQNIDSRKTYYLPVFNVNILKLRERSQAENNAFEGWFQDHLKLFPFLDVTLGVRYQNAGIGQVFYDTSLVFQRWNPLLGISLRLTNSTLLRAAAFRRLNKDIASSNIFPPTVAGFPLDRNELPATQRRELAVALEQSFRNTFLMAQASYRKIEDLSSKTPYRFAFADLTVKQTGLDFYLNQVLARRWSLFADNQYRQENNAEVIRRDNQARVGLNFIHEKGFFVRLTNSYVTQRFINTNITELTDATYNLTDLELKYEFLNKHGKATLAVNNLFDRKFNSFVEGLSVQRPRPKRTVVLILDWRF